MEDSTEASSKFQRATHVATVDTDPEETREWLDALEAVVRVAGHDRALLLLRLLEEQAQQLGIVANVPPYSAYRNTIPLEQEGPYPGRSRSSRSGSRRSSAGMRWRWSCAPTRRMASSAATSRATRPPRRSSRSASIISSARDDGRGGDLVFFQPHSAPGVYARAFLEGRLSEEQLANYRQEVGGGGLSSYPHPWLMPDFWQFPTGSMGIGPISAIYQARFMRYLQHRGIADTGARRVWGVFGDGEMDEPESIGALTLAARENLDNLTFVINCNLQRLDGPVRGNGQIIQELESLFSGAGWNVIKVLWGSDWDPLFARDKTHSLLRAFADTPDGEYQTLGAKDGGYNLEHFFGRAPELRETRRAHERERDRRAEARRSRLPQALRRVSRGDAAPGTRRRSSSPRPRRASAWARPASRA